MFGIFKKKEPATKPDPVAEKMAERIREQTEIAELQSQVAELRRRSDQLNAEIAIRTKERARLMEEIKVVPPAQKTVLALRVKNIDQVVAKMHGNLALIEQQIGNNESVILQKGTTETIDVGNVANVVDFEKHKGKIQVATETKRTGDINVSIAEDMLGGLTGDADMIASDVADILAEAEGSGTSVSPASSDVPAEDDRHPGYPESMSRF